MAKPKRKRKVIYLSVSAKSVKNHRLVPGRYYIGYLPKKKRRKPGPKADKDKL